MLNGEKEWSDKKLKPICICPLVIDQIKICVSSAKEMINALDFIPCQRCQTCKTIAAAEPIDVIWNEF